MQPVMNNTKWEELRLAMYSMDSAPQWRTLSSNGFLSRPDREWYYHFSEGGYNDIIYVDIYADDSSHRELIRTALQLIHLPGKEMDLGFRVFGYVEDGQEACYL